MTNTYPGSNLEIIEKAIYCNEHGDTESCENWLNHLRERLVASAAPAFVPDVAAELRLNRHADDPIGEVVSLSDGTATVGLYGDDPKVGDLVYAGVSAAPAEVRTNDELMRLLTEYEGALQSEDEEEIAPAREALLDFLRPIRVQPRDGMQLYARAALATTPTMSEAVRPTPEQICAIGACTSLAELNGNHEIAKHVRDFLRSVERIDRANAEGEKL
jgi:hypothetical protein